MRNEEYDAVTDNSAEELKRLEACMEGLPIDCDAPEPVYPGEWPGWNGWLSFDLEAPTPERDYTYQLLEYVEDTAKELLKRCDDELALSYATNLERVTLRIRVDMAARKERAEASKLLMGARDSLACYAARLASDGDIDESIEVAKFADHITEYLKDAKEK